MMIRVIIADDHAVMRDGLRLILGTQKDMTILGDAGDGREAVALARDHRPDVAVLDIAMPNLNGIEASIASDYEVSSHILDNYYESFEQLLLGQIQWCFSAQNSYEDGEGWNKEDFSIVDPDGEPRSELAYARPHARAMAGKLISTHFYSDFHYYDPDKGEVDPVREFEVTYESRVTTAPTVIFTAEKVQYPRGFYVWLSDGYAYYDPERQLLYHYPTADDPEAIHSVRLRPPTDGLVMEDWDYFIQDERVVDGPARGR